MGGLNVYQFEVGVVLGDCGFFGGDLINIINRIIFFGKVPDYRLTGVL